MDIPLFLFSGQFLFYIKYLGSCWKEKHDAVYMCLWIFDDAGALLRERQGAP